MLAGTELHAAEIPRGPDLGQPASVADIRAWDITVMADGAGLPPGSGTARAGAVLYAAQCQSCHGRDGLGDSGDQLAGARHRLTDPWPEKTVGTFWPYAPVVFDFIRRSMPMRAPGSLSDDQVYALTAYVLYMNGIVGLDDEMNRESLPEVAMPNRDGFIDVYNAARDASPPRR